MGRVPRFVSVDAPFLISLAKGDPACESSVDLVSRFRLFIVVPECAVKTILDICDNETNQAVKQAAEKARSLLPVWGFLQDGLTDVEDVIAEGAAKLIEEQLGVTKAISRILAEVSVHKSVLFLSDDPAIIDIDSKILDVIFLDRDLSGYVTLDPSSFAEVATKIMTRGA